MVRPHPPSRRLLARLRTPGILNRVNGQQILAEGQLRQLRESKGVRVNELARAMGAQPSTVCRIERSKNPLNESTILRYVRALGFRAELRFVPTEEASVGGE